MAAVDEMIYTRMHLVFLIVLFAMKLLFPDSSSSSHYRETGGITMGMLIA
jgi:hypothetical protein